MSTISANRIQPVFAPVSEAGSSVSLSPIKTAIIPVGGLGTRMLPATNSVPKNMLMVGDKPLIEYAVEEAMLAGCTKIVIVCSPNDKETYFRHFNPRDEITAKIQSKPEIKAKVEQVMKLGADLEFVVQEEPKGLGHAVLMGKDFVDGPFVVILPDDLMLEGTTPNTIRTMVNHYNGGVSIATQHVSLDDVSKYGIFEFVNNETEGQPSRIASTIVEKPAKEDAPSQEAAMGRYILPLSVMQALETTEAGKGGEIQLTDAIATVCAQGETLNAVQFPGVRYDCGDRNGFRLAQHQISGMLLMQAGYNFNPAQTRTFDHNG